MGEQHINTNFKMTELGPLPEDWEVVRLGEINSYRKEIINPSDFSEEIFEYYSIPAYQEGKKPIFEKGKNIRSQKFLLKNGIVLFGKLNPRVEKVWFVESSSNYRLIGSTEWIPIEASKKSDPFFLYYLMWSEYVMPKAKKMVSGSTPSRQRIDLQKFFQIKIPLPPLPEQKAMARVLKAIQDAIEATERVIAAVKELKKSLMRHLFTYGPVPVSERDRVRLKQTEIGPIPEDWEVKTANEVFYKITDGTHDTPKKLDQGIPLIKSKQIKQGKIDFNSIDYYISEIDYQIINRRSKVDKYDVLISMIGTIGEVAFIEDEPLFAIKNVGLFKTKMNYYLGLYSFYWFQTENAKNWIFNNLSGTTQKYIPLAKLRNFPIPLPPLPIQQKIAQILKAVDNKIEAEEKKKEALQAFFKTMLHHLMTGKIRVKIESKNFSLE